MLIQILITLLASVAIVSAGRRFHKGALSKVGLLFWLILWMAVLMALWNPWITNRVAGFLGVGRGADAVLYISVVLLFYTAFRLYGRIEHLEHQLSELTKQIALQDIERKM